MPSEATSSQRALPTQLLGSAHLLPWLLWDAQSYVNLGWNDGICVGQDFFVTDTETQSTLNQFYPPTFFFHSKSSFPL